MAIIIHSKGDLLKYTYLNIFPDQFKTEKQRQSDDWIKETMDYFTNKAYSEYTKNKRTFAKNYDLVKGIIRPEDFYEDNQTKEFIDVLTKDIALPKYVQHYSIISTPLNELVGEITKRPDEQRVKAFDDDSRSEELAFKSDLLQQFVVQQARTKILERMGMAGEEEPSEEEIQALTLEQIKDELLEYTSAAENWGNNVLEASKAEYKMKEQSEEGFRDLNIANREFFHIYEDNSKTGFNIIEENPKNVWFLTTPDRKYISDPTGRGQGAYAAGTIKVMEFSEIIETFPDLTKEEIDHLRDTIQDEGLVEGRESNLFNNTAPGINSITYDTYDPLVLQEKMMIEAEMMDANNSDSLSEFLGLSGNVSAFGYKFVVCQSYWISKKKIAKVTYEDEVGNIQTILVDEEYTEGTIPTEINVEWGWINQWYMGTKIGQHVYHVKPFKLLNYCPLIGVVFDIKNTESRSTVDMMKPFQVLYNVCMNQLFELLKKEIGNVASVNIRRIPRLKDGDNQDALDVWEEEARERGIVFDDDSPENTKAPVTNTSVAKNLDLTRTNEIQSRYSLAVALKNECWELIGMSKQRLGSISASESATGTQAAITQSYAQTEPVVVAHEYVMNQVYQAIIDASLYIESQKPTSTISYINSQGSSAFVQINGSDLKLRDLKVFVTNRPEDKEAFKSLRELSQAVIQNGGSLHDIIELYSTNSIRKMKKVFRTLKEQQEALQQSTIQQNQQKLDQDGAAMEAELQQARELEERKMANENMNKELDRINKREVAIISALGFGKVEGEDVDGNGVPDVYDSAKLDLEREKATTSHAEKLAEQRSKDMAEREKLKLEWEKLKVARENMLNDEKIAKLNKQGRQNKKPSK